MWPHSILLRAYLNIVTDTYHYIMQYCVFPSIRSRPCHLVVEHWCDAGGDGGGCQPAVANCI